MLIIFKKLILILTIFLFNNLALADKDTCKYFFDSDQATLDSIDIDVN